MSHRLLVWLGLVGLPLLALSVALSSAAPVVGVATPLLAPSPAGHTPSGWVNDTGAQPPFEQGAGMAYDPLTHSVVLVTTNNVVISCHAYTWMYSHGSWSNQTSSISGAPQVSQHPGFVYDASDGYMLLYGGYDNCLGGNAATWAFQNNSWTQIVTVGHPPVGINFGMAYDAHDGYVVLYGGTNGRGAGAVSNQTWTYHAGAWTQVTTTRSPYSGEVTPQMASNSVTGGVLLFGGGGSGGRQIGNQTWSYASGVWTQVKTTGSPPQVTQGLLEFSPNLGFVLFGGYEHNVGYEQYTWLYANGAWRNVTSSLAASPQVYPGYDTGAYNAASHHVMLFLSPNGAGTAQQTWSLV
jgi:hypothetical protein